MASINKISLFHNEIFKEIFFDESMQLNYVISNFGRLISFKENILDGRVVKGSNINGHRVFRYKIYNNGKTINKHKMFSRMVAEKFLNRTSEDQTFVLHLDYMKDNDRADNLKWATNQKMYEHTQKSPLGILVRQHNLKYGFPSPNAKLNPGKVKIIKKMVNKSNQTRQKMIAKQFGVSATQIKRITRGENWQKVKID